MAVEREQPGRSPRGAAPLPTPPAVVTTTKPRLDGPVEPPQPALVAAGFNGGIEAFNDAIAKVAHAHREAYGTDPSPGVALDVARSDVPEHQYATLFSVPKDPTQARMRGVLREQGIDPATAPPAPKSALGGALAQDLNDVHTRDDVNSFLADNADTISRAVADPASREEFETAFAAALSRADIGVPLAGKPSHEAQQLADALDNVQHRGQLDAFFAKDNQRLIARALSTDPVSAQAVTNAYHDAAQRVGLDPASNHDRLMELGYGGFLSRAAGETALGLKQVATGLTLGPALLAREEAKAVYHSATDLSLAPLAHTNVELAKGVGQGIVRDVEHPAANPGNLFLDIFGAASLGAGGVARLGAAGRAFAAREGAASVARALLTKPMTGTFTLGEGAETPLSGNPLVAQIQKLVYTRRLKGLGAEESSGPVPAGAASAIADDKATTLADHILPEILKSNFSIENKIGRQLRANDRVERAVRMSLLQPLDLATGAAKSTSLVARRMGIRSFRGLSLGEQKAIQVLTLDDPSPLEAWQAFHERAIDQGIGDPQAHAAQLALLEQARKVLQKPSPKFLKALDAVRDVSDEQTRLRIEQLGLTPEAAEGRVAALGQVVRGDVGDASANARVPALTSSNDILRFAALGKTPEEIADELMKPNPEAAGENGLPRYSSHEAALKAVRATLDTPEAKRALTPQRVRSGRQVADSTYLLYQSLANKRRRFGTFFRPQAGPFGVPRPADIPELHHYFTGDAIRAGDFRIDSTRLASETYARTIAAAIKLSAWKRLHDHYATDTPQSEYDIPIRDSRNVDDELKAILAKADNGQVVTAEDVRGLSPQMVEDLGRYLMPHPDDVTRADAAGKWRWFDERLLGSEPRSGGPTPIVRAFSALNEPLRDLTIFVRPAYLLNILNSASMLAIDEGVFAIPNFVRALRAESEYGPKVANILDGMAGEGRMLSYAPKGGLSTRVSRGLAQHWNRVTDLYFRRAATIFYLRKLGYRTTEQIKQVTLDSLHDPKALKDVTEASQRAKKSMVELDNLTPVEKNALRHLIFVYPWVSRSAVWSLRTIVEHPAQAAIFSEIAQSKEKELDPILKHLPSWMRDSGYIPVGFDAQGRPKVVNSGSVNTFSTLAEMAGIAQGDQTFTDLLGPGADLVVRLAEERDRFGRAYKHPYLDPFVDTLTGLPQLSALKRAGEQEPAEPPLDIKSETGLISQEHADVHRPVFVPGGFWNSYGPLIAGGLTPRTIDPKAVDARWWQAQPWPVRHQHESKLLQKMAGIQGKFISKPVPADVRDALRLVSDRTAAYHAFSQDKGHTPTMVERTSLDIATLESQGRLTGKEADKLRESLTKTAPDELDIFRTAVINKYGGGKALSDWHRQVALVARVSNPRNLDGDIQQLIGAGVLPSSMKDAADAEAKPLREYALEFLAYDAKVREYAKREKEARARGDKTTSIAEGLRVFQDEQDKPVVIDGHRFPSLPRLAVAHLTPTQLNAHIADNYSRNLATLSALDKDMIGIHSSAGNTTAWAQLESTLRETRKQDPTRSDLSIHNAAVATNLAKQIDDYYKLGGSFVDEVKLSLEPRWKVLKQTRLYTDSDNKPTWDALFQAAATETKYLSDPGYDHAATRRQWDSYARTDLPQQIKNQSPAFWRELQPYLHANPSFLADLISR